MHSVELLSRSNCCCWAFALPTNRVPPFRADS